MNQARCELVAAWGGVDTGIAAGWAPGRCTLVGEHVDYAGGVIVAFALDLRVEVAVRAAATATFRVASAGRYVERTGTEPNGDIGDRILAAVEVLRRRGIDVPVVDVGVAATLPEAAGLSSSAAVTCATLVALLRLTGTRVCATDFVDAALAAERDVVGVPCGSLDQLTIVYAMAENAMVIDAASGSVSAIAWPWTDIGVVACFTGEGHDVGGFGYRTRRKQAAAVLEALGATSAQEIALAATQALPQLLRRRARHLAGETQRSLAAVMALREGNVRELGRLMMASHVSLRDDYEVSTPKLDAVVAAALGVEGCWGARLVGAGFGGTVIALVDAAAAPACAATMAAAVGADPAAVTWSLRPAAGVAASNPAVVISA